MKKVSCYIYIGILMLLLAGCQTENVLVSQDEDQEEVYVTYHVGMGNEAISRAIGDGAKVNELKVGVFQQGVLLEIFTYEKEENVASFTDVAIPLMKNRNYDLVFWAQKKDNGIYSIDTDNFNLAERLSHNALHRGTYVSARIVNGHNYRY